MKEVEEIIKLNKVFDFVILGAYNAMFHAARALLYKDEIQEKSHFAIYIYLKEKYSDKIPINVLNFLNIHRVERHEAIYGIDYKPEREDAELALKDARIFVGEIEKVIGGNENTKIIRLFEQVQKIPYIVCKFEADRMDETLKEGDCRHKATLLYNLLQKEGLKVKKIKVIFDWKDLPIPVEILSNLRESSTIWDHNALAVKINDQWIKIDCTWDLALDKAGFPVTKNWDGKSNTLQITNGKLKFIGADKYFKDKKIKIIKEEAHAFAEALNKWMRGLR